MMRVLVFHGALLITAVMVEVFLLIYAYQYERQIAPAGVFTLMGLAGTGGLTIAIEAMKLPLAVHLIGARGLYRIIAWGGIILLCGLTFMTMKDMVNNQGIVALAPSEAMRAEADRLDSENQAMADSGEQRRIAAASAREDLRELESTGRERIAKLRSRRNIVSQEWKQRIGELRANGLFDPLTRETLETLSKRRDVFLTESESRATSLDLRIAEARDRHATAVANADARHQRAVSAWEIEMQRHEAGQKARRTEMASAAAVASQAYEQDLASFDRAVGRLEAARLEIRKELARRIEAHRENDGPFYDLKGRIATEQAWAESELARIEAERSSLTPPSRPSFYDSASQVVASPTRPILSPIDTAAIDRLEAERREFLQARDLGLAQIDAEAKGVRERAAVVSRERKSGDDALMARAIAERDRRLSEVDEEIRSEEGELARGIAALRAVAIDEVAVQSFAADAAATSEGNAQEALRLRHEANRLRAETEVFRIAEFLRPFLPETDDDRLIEIARTGQAIVLAFICAVAPAMLLKSAIYHLFVVPGPRSTPSGLGVGARGSQARRFGRLESRFKIRTERLQADLEAQTQRSKEEIDRTQREGASTLATSLAVQARLHEERIAAVTIERERQIAEISAEQASRSREIEELQLLVRRERDRANASDALVAERSSALEQAAAQREQLRDQRLQDAMNLQNRQAHSSADVRFRGEIDGLKSRYEALDHEAAELRRDRRDLMDDNRAQRDVISRHMRTISGMREDLERLGRTLIDIDAGHAGGISGHETTDEDLPSRSPKVDALPELKEFLDDDDLRKSEDPNPSSRDEDDPNDIPF